MQAKENRKEELQQMYAAKLADRTKKAKSGPLFQLVEVKREAEPGRIQCCIR